MLLRRICLNVLLVAWASFCQGSTDGGRALLVVDMTVEQWANVEYRKGPVLETVKNLVKNTTVFFDLIVDSHLWMRCHPPQSSLCHLTTFSGGRVGKRSARLLDELSHSWVTFAEKQHYSCFYGSTLDALLREAHIQTLYVVGINTNYCVFATVLEAFERAYDVRVVMDGVTSIDGEQGHLDGVKMLTTFFGATSGRVKLINSSDIPKFHQQRLTVRGSGAPLVLLH